VLENKYQLAFWFGSIGHCAVGVISYWEKNPAESHQEIPLNARKIVCDAACGAAHAREMTRYD
jgi:2-keto-4-pentenoate hydratase/2-oxohepta-3-ene-1,7-dioic acid hydratase in catechol pathway